jgi:hypothetical protein
VKLWILSASILFFLFLTFFARQFPKYNGWFSAYLLFSVGLQILFSISLAAGFTRRIPMTVLDVVGWGLILMAALAAVRAQDAVNEVIQNGLGMVIIFNLLALAAIWFHQAPASMRVWTSNVACFVPSGYMLVRFSFVMSDGLPLWVRQILNSRFNVQEVAGAAVGVARSMFS